LSGSSPPRRVFITSLYQQFPTTTLKLVLTCYHDHSVSWSTSTEALQMYGSAHLRYPRLGWMTSSPLVSESAYKSLNSKLPRQDLPAYFPRSTNSRQYVDGAVCCRTALSAGQPQASGNPQPTCIALIWFCFPAQSQCIMVPEAVWTSHHACLLPRHAFAKSDIPALSCSKKSRRSMFPRPPPSARPVAALVAS
jgi:hypothetical protein